LSSVASFVDGTTGVADALQHTDSLVATHAFWAGGIRDASGRDTDTLHISVACKPGRTRAALAMAQSLASRVDAASVDRGARINTQTLGAQLV
jgi:hypothetical protein